MLSTCILTGAMEDSPPEYRQDHRSSTTVRYQGKKGLNRLIFLDTVVVYEGKFFCYNKSDFSCNPQTYVACE